MLCCRSSLQQLPERSWRGGSSDRPIATLYPIGGTVWAIVAYDGDYPESIVQEQDRIVAVSLLTAEEVRVLGSSLKRVYSLPSDGRFDDLLRRLDEENDATRRSG
jgi:hypothetical protein